MSSNRINIVDDQFFDHKLQIRSKTDSKNALQMT